MKTIEEVEKKIIGEMKKIIALGDNDNIPPKELDYMRGRLSALRDMMKYIDE